MSLSLHHRTSYHQAQGILFRQLPELLIPFEFYLSTTCILVDKQAQCILFRQYPEVLAPFKYAGYPLLLDAVRLPEEGKEAGSGGSGSTSHFLGPDRASRLQVASLSASVIRCPRTCLGSGLRGHDQLVVAAFDTVPQLRTNWCMRDSLTG